MIWCLSSQVSRVLYRAILEWWLGRRDSCVVGFYLYRDPEPTVRTGDKTIYITEIWGKTHSSRQPTLFTDELSHNKSHTGLHIPNLLSPTQHKQLPFIPVAPPMGIPSFQLQPFYNKIEHK